MGAGQVRPTHCALRSSLTPLWSSAERASQPSHAHGPYTPAGLSLRTSNHMRGEAPEAPLADIHAWLGGASVALDDPSFFLSGLTGRPDNMYLAAALLSLAATCCVLSSSADAHQSVLTSHWVPLTHLPLFQRWPHS